MKRAWSSPSGRFVSALLVSSLVSEALFAYAAIHNHSLEFDYLSWNLVLAWIPLILATRLTYVLRHKLWSSWEGLGLTFLWLIFLPNSFYMISDFIHLQDISQANVVYYALVLTSFIYTGVILGFASLLLIHLQLKRRLTRSQTTFWIALTLFVCSVAIYFGRDLRWNSWDVLTNPGGLLFDISERVRHLISYPDMITTILGFFILLLTMYNLIWRGAHLFHFSRSQS